MELRGDLPGGRRELRIRIGSFAVEVTEVPGRSLTEREWRDIVLARNSYTAMWGGDDPDVLTNDPHDGRDSSIYDTRHYMAWVQNGAGAPKLVTMRKVRLVPSALSPAQRADPFPLLPVDVQLWRVRAEGGRSVRLWDVLRAHAGRLAPRDRLPEFRIAAIGRTGTYPYGERDRMPGTRERTAIAFAAIQLLATHGDPSLMYVCSLCPEFRDRVLGLVDVDGAYVPPDFTRTEEVLGLPPGSVGLDNDLQVVQQLKASYPGYWVHNCDAARLIGGLLDEGCMTIGDLRSTIARLVQGETVSGGDLRRLDELAAAHAARDHRGLAEILTRPHLFKYLIPLISGEQPLSRMSGAEFRAQILSGTMDGPFSSTLIPARWTTSAWAILEAAEEKYGAHRTIGPLEGGHALSA